MRIIISENSRQNIVYNWLDSKYANIPGVNKHNSEDGDWIDYDVEDNNTDESIFQYYYKDNSLFFNGYIWTFIADMFDYETKELNYLLMEWFESRYGLEVKELF